MSIRVALNHVTHYRYDRCVTLLPHVVRLRPAPHCRTPILSYSLRVLPEPHFLNWQQDPYSNFLARLVFLKPAREFRVQVDLIAEMTAINPFDFYVEAAFEKYPFQYDDVSARELVPYLETAAAGPRLQAMVEELRRRDVRTVDFLVEINRVLQQHIRYVIRLEPGIQSCEDTLEKRSGSCRDSAWLLVQLARHLGLAARFVSGYLIQLASDVKSLDGPSGPESDFTDLHAWAEIYLPGAGWIGLDPTSGLLAGEGHIPLACSAEPITAAPITGTYEFDVKEKNDRCAEEFHFQMAVQRIRETPRTTKPYTAEQWQAIDTLGRHIDRDLRDMDVRLTMGGEPTFVSMDDFDSPQWTIAALGEDKRHKAGKLLLRLRDRFGPNGLLHFGQGKWYPGESLPRWALGCYWRRDGVPVWHDVGLIADESRDYHHGPYEAKRFISLLAENLGIGNGAHPSSGDVPSLALRVGNGTAGNLPTARGTAAEIPAYEDVWHYLCRERRLPANVDPLKNRLEDPEERQRLARIFEQGLGKIVGYVLPLRRHHDGTTSTWQTGPWFLRGEHLFLVPGDSPMGYRLPLDSLLWEVPEKVDKLLDLDPFAPRGPLPGTKAGPAETGATAFSPAYRQRQGYRAGQPMLPQRQPQALLFQTEAIANGESALPAGVAEQEASAAIIRTALCVEPRHGRLYVFMPPQRHLEDYLDLVAAVEETAAELRMPVLIEGYTPPADQRLAHLHITPDPGVIEVNIQPAHNWTELVDHTRILYEEAHQTRLCTEKFMLDGRHTGTGGGNHIVIGGPSPADSPVLRRPDLLRSLIGYWHNHPSLSYLFSGLFLGPTSQAPRIDEARNDSIYEMELAFQQIERMGEGEKARKGDWQTDDVCENGPVSQSSRHAPTATDHPFWLVDRIFRHLLTDVTGNTHRAEFCIDKLFPAESANGRRGLVEMRAFEMPPHADMSLAQQVLLRALIARFWKEPYQHKLVRWGTQLHDRFMLPYFIDQDFRDVLEELRRRGLPVQDDWFAAHREFRFPFVGSVTHQAIQIELRQAIEPWHVLGEEQQPGGTARYVDSSVERLQVRVVNLTDSRHVVTCNGRRLPLHPTGVNGEFVAGIRFRAWQPPSCLHPTIGVHSPLVLDVIDTWMNRSIGGCTYYVAHPGGRGHTTFPVNSREAEARRIARFFPFGHTAGNLVIGAEERCPEAPLTLDLRRTAAGGPTPAAAALNETASRSASFAVFRSAVDAQAAAKVVR